MLNDEAQSVGRANGDSLSLDGAAALLVQLDATDVAELEVVRSALVQVAGDEPADSTVRRLVADAVRLLDGLIEGCAPDPGSALAEIGSLLERIMETIGSRPRSRPFRFDFEPEMVQYFIDESRGFLEQAEAALLRLESDPDDSESCNTVFRAFHTIKGTSGFLDLHEVTELAHWAESLLSRVRDGELRFGGASAELAFRSVDVLGALISSVEDALESGRISVPSDYDVLLRELQSAGDGPDAVEGSAIAPEFAGLDIVDTSETRETDDHGGVGEGGGVLAAGDDADAVRVVGGGTAGVDGDGDRGAGGDDGGRADDGAPDGRNGRDRGRRRGSSSWVRVRMDRLDSLVDMVGELVIAHSMIVQDVQQHDVAARNVSHAGKILRELQDLTIAMRMVPLKATFQRMARLARDVARRRGKLVDFVTSAEETEIDRNMVDFITDPLVHMIRNAVDHGIEPPDEREALGKPRRGVVRLSAYHAQGNVVIELSDDGRGLDREKIARKAIARGLIETDRGLSDSDVFELIFAPGFSTADTLTDVSGRGVGMDVVRRNIEALGGRIDISSVPGRGSTFALRVPLTLALTDGMLVGVGEERYIIPTISIQMSFRPTRSALSTVAGRGELVLFRDALLPVVRLHRLFSTPGAVTDPTEGLLVVIGSGERRCALLVDELLAQHQVVAKPLGEAIGQVQGISGAAILGDGRVGLILDPAQIIALARQGGAGRGLRPVA